MDSLQGHRWLFNAYAPSESMNATMGNTSASILPNAKEGREQVTTQEEKSHNFYKEDLVCRAQ